MPMLENEFWVSLFQNRTNVTVDHISFEPFFGSPRYVPLSENTKPFFPHGWEAHSSNSSISFRVRRSLRIGLFWRFFKKYTALATSTIPAAIAAQNHHCIQLAHRVRLCSNHHNPLSHRRMCVCKKDQKITPSLFYSTNLTGKSSVLSSALPILTAKQKQSRLIKFQMVEYR